MLPTWYLEYKKFIDKSINWFLNNYLDYEFSEAILKFMEIIYYSTGSWKRVRAILALEVYLCLNWKTIEDIKADDDIIKICCALEFIHAYSLIHDDMPCMDNDEFRRWQLTVWKKYWETNAVLCWDLLNTLAFEILSTIKDDMCSKKIINLISRASSIYWMLWWQIEDIFYENNWWKLNLEILEKLHIKKTWKIIEASVLASMLLSWDLRYMEMLSNFAKQIWLAFQVKDDILDEEWTFEETWKSVWGEKKWFVHFIWIVESKKYLEDLTSDAMEEISDLKSEKLEFLVEYIKNRNN